LIIFYTFAVRKTAEAVEGPAGAGCDDDDCPPYERCSFFHFK